MFLGGAGHSQQAVDRATRIGAVGRVRFGGDRTVQSGDRFLVEVEQLDSVEEKL
ncbi:hypothetical protein [Brasilonema sp. UFV-L1]|uniref:hypothetical protein n=1 Tax=Brasilonema sp. UFV-L1 TaxID=2234130 RepID=UPI00145E34B5|nr:hypothetical protein [Brasilonema sp. UFV-L1]